MGKVTKYIIGKLYVLDGDRLNNSIVELVYVGKIYCIVKSHSGTGQWEVMKDRLTEIE